MIFSSTILCRLQWKTIAVLSTPQNFAKNSLTSMPQSWISFLIRIVAYCFPFPLISIDILH